MLDPIVLDIHFYQFFAVAVIALLRYGTFSMLEELDENGHKMFLTEIYLTEQDKLLQLDW